MPDTDPAVQEWRSIARSDDLLYDVLSWPDKRNRWKADEFYASGASDWADFKRHWDHFEPERGDRCVEIGCGVGRLTTQLATAFPQLTAIDVSSDMIQRARAAAPTGVTFHQVDGPVIPVASDEVDAVFSVHVMQHLENSDVLVAYIREMARVLRPGGTVMIHIPLQGTPLPNPLRRLQAELRLRASRRALKAGQSHSTMRTNAYWLDEVWLAFTGAGFTDVELRLIPVRSNGYGHQFWLARKR